MSGDRGPLAGFRVLDFTHALAGPYCTMLLGDLDADVVKVEPPDHGDQSRLWGPPFINGESAYFISINRNKRGIVLNLRHDSGRAAALALAMESDVVVENFKPGVAARLGVGHEQLRAAKPALVYASVSGYGQSHPEMAGYDQIAQGTSGLMSLTGPPGGPPTKVGIPIGDVAAGMFAAQAIMAALLARARTGAGAHIDVALNDSLIAMLAYQAGRFFAIGSPPRAEGNFHSTIAPYGTFQAADGAMNIAVASDEQYARFCSALEASELTSDERFRTNADRQQHRDELTGEIEGRLRRRTRDEWLSELVKAGIPAGPILDIAEAFGSPLADGMRVEIDHPGAGLVGQVAPPIRFDGCRPPIRRAPPRLGEHTDEVLEELLGYSRQQSQAAST